MKLAMLALWSVPLAAACLDPTQPAPDEEPAAGADPAAGDGDGEHIVTEEGAFGRVRVQTVDGSMLLSYQVVAGRAIHELDLDLGPVELLRARGGAARLGMQWPNGVIHYAFDEDFVGSVCNEDNVDCVNARTLVRNTLVAMEAKLPFDFRERSIDDIELYDTTVVIRFVEGQATPGAADHIGMKGAPSGILGVMQYISFRAGISSEDVPGTLRHEMLHVAGLWHEQSRRDRNEFISVNYVFCIQGGEGNGNYDIQYESADLGPYDFRSIMHYPDTEQCNPPLVPAQDPDGDGCWCKTMTPKVEGASFGGDGVPRGGLSVEDTNTVYRMYARTLGDPSPGDGLGKAIAIGDFDGDGYDDLAVGIPDDNVTTGIWPASTSHADAGMVMVWKGTSAGPVAWRALTAASSGHAVTAGMRFGAALAAYDLNADGISDLAIGAPGAAGGAGAVYVWRGTTQTGLVAHRYLTQANTGIDDDEAGDRFGAALAAGPITGLVRPHTWPCDQLPAVDHPVDALVVGAPGDRVTIPFAASRRSGSVFLYQETRQTCSTSSTLNLPTRLSHGFGHTGVAEGDDFGAGLAVGDLDGDGLADLAVGAPGFGGGDGKVYLYQGRLPPENPFAWSAMATEQGSIEYSLGTRFGAALAIGKLLSYGRHLAVGAPGGNGRVIVYSGAFSPTIHATITHAAPAAGDEFGAALAIGNVDGASSVDDLVIGAPGDDADAGSITIVRGGTLGLPGRTLVTQGGTLAADRDPGDRYGAALAIGSLDGGDGRTSTAISGTVRLDLAVGAPGEIPDVLLDLGSTQSGAVDLLRGRPSTIVGPWRQQCHVSTGLVSE